MSIECSTNHPPAIASTIRTTMHKINPRSISASPQKETKFLHLIYQTFLRESLNQGVSTPDPGLVAPASCRLFPVSSFALFPGDNLQVAPALLPVPASQSTYFIAEPHRNSSTPFNKARVYSCRNIDHKSGVFASFASRRFLSGSPRLFPRAITRDAIAQPIPLNRAPQKTSESPQLLPRPSQNIPAHFLL